MGSADHIVTWCSIIRCSAFQGPEANLGIIFSNAKWWLEAGLNLPPSYRDVCCDYSTGYSWRFHQDSSIVDTSDTIGATAHKIHVAGQFATQLEPTGKPLVGPISIQSSLIEHLIRGFEKLTQMC